MKTKAIMVFTVSYAGIRIKVRLLPTCRDVHREYMASPSATRARVGKGKTVCGFSSPTRHVMAKHTAMIVLGADGPLDETIPHEVFHTVIDKFKNVHFTDDEAAATAVGILSSRITRKIAKGVRYE